MEVADIQFPQLPFPGSMALIGASFSGKTSLLLRLLEQKDYLFTEPIQKVIYCHAEEAPISLRNGDVILHEGLPDEAILDQWLEDFAGLNIVLCFDDMQAQFYSSAICEKLMTRLTHHRKIFFILLGHHIFGSGKHARLASLNFHAYILTRTCRDLSQIAYLGRQLLGKGQGNKFLDIYLDATQLRPDGAPGYLYISIHPLFSQPGHMLFTHIFEDEKPLILYR